jgi:hypothetical protein
MKRKAQNESNKYEAKTREEMEMSSRWVERGTGYRFPEKDSK